MSCLWKGSNVNQQYKSIFALFTKYNTLSLTLSLILIATWLVHSQRFTSSLKCFIIFMFNRWFSIYMGVWYHLSNPQNNDNDVYNQYHSVLSDLVNYPALLIIRICSSWLSDYWIQIRNMGTKFGRDDLSMCEIVCQGWKFNMHRFSFQVHDICKRHMSKVKSDYYTKLFDELNSILPCRWT